MPLPAKHSPALAAHNLRNRIAATKSQNGYATTVDVPIYDARMLLKERDGLVAALQACLDAAAKGRNRDDPTRSMHPLDAALFRTVQAVLASARGT